MVARQLSDSGNITSEGTKPTSLAAFRIDLDTPILSSRVPAYTTNRPDLKELETAQPLGGRGIRWEARGDSAPRGGERRGDPALSPEYRGEGTCTYHQTR